LDKKFGIEELIVVEGKNDAHAVRRALGKVDVVWTEGFGLTEEKLYFISKMAKTRGVIVCTDPDFAGRQIRERLIKSVPEARHVYLSKDVAAKGDDIGLENVSPEEIRKAFSKVLAKDVVMAKSPDDQDFISIGDMLNNGLIGHPGSAAKRAEVGKVLGIGDTNAKQFLHRVNRLAISREEFLHTLVELRERTED